MSGKGRSIGLPFFNFCNNISKLNNFSFPQSSFSKFGMRNFNTEKFKNLNKTCNYHIFISTIKQKSSNNVKYTPFYQKTFFHSKEAKIEFKQTSEPLFKPSSQEAVHNNKNINKINNNHASRGEEYNNQSGKLINGIEIANIIEEEIKEEVNNYKEKYNKVPKVAVIIVGERQDSKSYVLMKQKVAKRVGISFQLFSFPENVSEIELLKKVEELNEDVSVNGILIQLPLPPHINSVVVTSKVRYEKDVDGFHTQNVGKLALHGFQPLFVPCTPKGCLELLKRSSIQIEGKDVVVVGRSNIVGTPLALVMMKNNATVTICHKKTQNLAEKVKKAEILFVAIGDPLFIKGDWISEGTVVVDIGINKIADSNSKTGYRIVGDVDFENAKVKASYLTPVPGGVGPMTFVLILFLLSKFSIKL